MDTRYIFIILKRRNQSHINEFNPVVAVLNVILPESVCKLLYGYQLYWLTLILNHPGHYINMFTFHILLLQLSLKYQLASVVTLNNLFQCDLYIYLECLNFLYIFSVWFAENLLFTSKLSWASWFVPGPCSLHTSSPLVSRLTVTSFSAPVLLLHYVQTYSHCLLRRQRCCCQAPWVLGR